MNTTSLVVLLVFIVTILLSVVGVFLPRKHKVFAVAGILACLIGGYSAWYAAVETRQLLWTIGYALVALAGIWSFRKHWR